MTKQQHQIGVGTVVVVLLLLLYPPWKLEFEDGYERIAFAFLFSPPSDYRLTIGNRIVSPQTQAIAAWMLLGEVVCVTTLAGALFALYRPTATAPAHGPTVGTPATTTS